MNRILDRIIKVRAALDAGVRVDDGEPLAPGALASLEKAMTITTSDHFLLQQTQAEAAAMQRITVEEAMTIYTALGEVPAADGWAEGTDLATKVVVMQGMGTLLSDSIARRRR